MRLLSTVFKNSSRGGGGEEGKVGVSRKKGESVCEHESKRDMGNNKELTHDTFPLGGEKNIPQVRERGSMPLTPCPPKVHPRSCTHNTQIAPLTMRDIGDVCW